MQRKSMGWRMRMLTSMCSFWPTNYGSGKKIQLYPISQGFWHLRWRRKITGRRDSTCSVKYTKSWHCLTRKLTQFVAIWNPFAESWQYPLNRRSRPSRLYLPPDRKPPNKAPGWSRRSWHWPQPERKPPNKAPGWSRRSWHWPQPERKPLNKAQGWSRPWLQQDRWPQSKAPSWRRPSRPWLLPDRQPQSKAQGWRRPSRPWLLPERKPPNKVRGWSRRSRP